MRSRRGSVHAMLGLGLIEKSRTPWVPFNRRVILLILLPTCKWLVQKLFHPESFVELVNQSIEIVGRVIMEKQIWTMEHVLFGQKKLSKTKSCLPRLLHWIHVKVGDVELEKAFFL
ncbi:uncharacterized protein LOC128195536 isoform X1 [Vigna angularis]|uniref:uncharacterized protein LOC128195536 isoform X1 n=1 Tax=Phaseolus angularis TaxID=3914 RepID=UPI0022B459B5|nr:uncharacterized protein LOC128195536 isoform X1 [Vigna angularis]